MTNLVPENEQQYGSILTVLGENAEQNGKLLNKQVEFTHIAFGDANDTYVQPDRKAQALVNELHRIPVNSVDVLQPTPDSVPILKVEAILPDDINDVVIREFAAVATFNGQTYFHAIGNCARVYVPKPINNGNVSNPVTLEMTFVITSADPIVEMDPTVVIASRRFVNEYVSKTVFSNFETVEEARLFSFSPRDKIRTRRYEAQTRDIWCDWIYSENDDSSRFSLSCENGYLLLVPTLGTAQFELNALQCGATGIDGQDQTVALQAWYDQLANIQESKAALGYLPFGTYQARYLTCDRTKSNRNIVLKGDVATDDQCSRLKFTDLSRSHAMEWDGGFHANKITFEFEGSRAFGTNESPRYIIDINNEDNSSVADVDVSFTDCIVDDFHRAIKMCGRGFLWTGGSIVNGGGNSNEGCFLDLEWPDNFTPGPYPDQTVVCGMRGYRINSPRIHACTGHLVRNKGKNANNLSQMQINNLFCDTKMGVMRGAIVNTEMNGGTFLNNSAIQFWCEKGFKFDGLNVSAPNYIGMPLENIGQLMSDGSLVTEEQVYQNATGTLVFIDPGAVDGGSLSWNGGILSDSNGDSFFIGKELRKVDIGGIVCKRLMRDNRTSDGQTRHFVNFNNKPTRGVTLQKILIDNMNMAKDGCLAGGDQLVREFEYSNNLLSGSIFESYTLPRNSDFGGQLGNNYCGKYTGAGDMDVRPVFVSAKRYIKFAQITRVSDGKFWNVLDGDLTGDVRVDGNQLLVKLSADQLDEEYRFNIFF
ncbi:phage tail protein [Vibrio vulnificus]|nr:phage tail protein [Vibrio vulnificus]